ncbi:Na/Pi cotransporter family protein [Thermospira aquatica]|uniref:Na/Pi cotransporter family protein n=1 Tax=Thermospira aquatica TaxID=2828656 RepID=A0AAX3BAS3_9SPIR|nr:Na/Pi cotransporter family protein [Thermospira aquatica]URA09338.1 Na/Pi cotransporter family protein [Thermospira aquatica]
MVSSLMGFFTFLGSLGIFLFGIRIMSEAIQRAGSEKIKSVLSFFTRNPFGGVVIGTLITGIIQSSSATTVMIVTLVHAQMMTLVQAISVIMGANIGTTFTAWIVSFFGFKFEIGMLTMPAIAIGFPLAFSSRENFKNVGEFLVGFGLLFFGLGLLKNSVPDLKNHLEVFTFIQKVSGFGYFSVLLSVVIGTLLTIIIQSSSAAMTITIALAYKGWIPYEMAFAFILGENIGTTITAYLASLGLNISAKRATRAHMLFNLIGVFWMLIVFYPFVHFVDWIIPGALTDTNQLPFHLSAFHSLFNIFNTLILVWFIPQIAQIVSWWVKPKKLTDETYELKPIRVGMPDFAEANISMAKREIGRMIGITYDMALQFLRIAREDLNTIEETELHIHEQDCYLEQMRETLSRFLAGCRTTIVNEKQSHEINAYLILTSEIKSISTSIAMLVSLLKKKKKKKLRFHKHGMDEIIQYTYEVLDFLEYTVDYLQEKIDEPSIELAQKMEKAINAKRNRLRKLVENKLIKGADIEGEIIYMEIVKHLEHIGDFCYTIASYLKDLI